MTCFVQGDGLRRSKGSLEVMSWSLWKEGCFQRDSELNSLVILLCCHDTTHPPHLTVPALTRDMRRAAEPDYYLPARSSPEEVQL